MDLKRKAEQGALVPVAKKTRQEVSVYGGETVSKCEVTYYRPLVSLINLCYFSYWSTQVVSGEADQSASIKNPRQALSFFEN